MIYAAGIIGLIFLIVPIAMYRHEKKMWNNGECWMCQQPWLSFDMDSSGATGYKCPCCRDVIWLSYFSPKIKEPKCKHDVVGG